MSEHPIDNPDPEEEPSERELRISQLLAEFLKQEDEGTAISRAQLLSEHADVAEDLKILLEMADMIQEMAGPLAANEFGLEAHSTTLDDWTAQKSGDHEPSQIENEGGIDSYLPGGKMPLLEGSAGTSEGVAFGDYQLLEVIGQGGMGIVYRARQSGINRDVAV